MSSAPEVKGGGAPRLEGALGSFVVDPRYRLSKLVGSGAYGVVASARDTLLDMAVAVKKIPRVFDVATIARRTLLEIKLLKHFSAHENVISVFSVSPGAASPSCSRPPAAGQADGAPPQVLRPPAHPAAFHDVYVVMVSPLSAWAATGA